MDAVKLWTPDPDRAQRSRMAAFMREVSATTGAAFPEYRDLYAWSIQQPERFWAAVWKFCGVIASRPYESVLDNPGLMPGARWFNGAKLSFAENLLRFRDDREALVFWGEEKARRRVSYAELYREVARMSAALRGLGVRSGDRVAGLVPNMPETVVAMLAAVSIGAVWTSCSPDFGTSGVLDRFGQTEPKVLFSVDGYHFKGGAIDCLAKTAEIAGQIPSIRKVIVIPYLTERPQLSGIRDAELFGELPGASGGEIEFEQLPFDHPLYIMYSSGTTGKPKCIVHGAGGTLIEHLKEHVLHTGVTREDRVFYQTTCGWMMWNWLVSGLAAGATLVLYDGSPFQRQGRILWDLAEQERVSVFGTNAKYISALEKEGLAPAASHDLKDLRAILSTGSPLAPESFDYVYASIKKDVCLSSISGGTDIIGCFALGCPLIPVHRGELQSRSLGLRVEVFDEDGRPVRAQKGELVCTAPFPSMPIGFWNDPDGEKYRQAYFSVYPNVWHHGDYVELTENEGMIFYGRSDTILNPGGVRIGTAEIYNQVEKLPEVAESLVISQAWENDERVVLFVRLKEGSLDEGLSERIRKQIRSGASPFHVPKKIVQVSDIPRTRSGKIVELAVKNVVHGRPVKNLSALANPEALDQFKDIAALKEP